MGSAAILHFSTDHLGAGANSWQQPLPALQADAMLVPSVAVMGAGAPLACRWHLLLAGRRIASLPWFPAGGDSPTDPALDSPGQATTAVDWFHCHAAMADAGLALELARPLPAGAWAALAVSLRPLHLSSDPGATGQPLPPVLLRVPELCQYHCPPLAGRAVGGAVCSPASIAMLAAWHGRPWPLVAAARACFDPVHRLFGVWPQNIQAAADHGLAGHVRCFTSMAQVHSLLAAGHPVAASIRFAEGALPGAPLPGTRGHLVVVRGLIGDRVLVNDPALPLPGAGSACMAYPLAPFARAWLAQRGVGYVLGLPAPSAPSP